MKIHATFVRYLIGFYFEIMCIMIKGSTASALFILFAALPSFAESPTQRKLVSNCLSLVQSAVKLKGRYEVRETYKVTNSSVEISWGVSNPINPSQKISELKEQILSEGDPDYSKRSRIGSITTISSLNAGVEEVQAGSAKCIVKSINGQKKVQLASQPEQYEGYTYSSARPVSGVLLK